jgi:hypothetical protein
VRQTIRLAALDGSPTATRSPESFPLAQRRALRCAEPDSQGFDSTITVSDARSSLVGWRTTVSLQTVSGLDAARLASTRLSVSPHPTT